MASPRLVAPKPPRLSVLANRLKKHTTENNATVNVGGTNYATNIVTITDYTSGQVYETKTYSNTTAQTNLGTPTKLQFGGQEEGRIRALYDNTNNPNEHTGFAYDYMLKEHLGNVRMVLTEEQKQDVYPATTLENATYNGGTAVSIESQYYKIDNSKIVSNPGKGFPLYQNNNGNPPFNNNPYSNTAANSTKIYKTNANANKIGLGITLKVMAGDNINIFGKSMHKAPVEGYTSINVNFSSVFSPLLEHCCRHWWNGEAFRQLEIIK